MILIEAAEDILIKFNYMFTSMKVITIRIIKAFKKT